ncbi:MAG TPA: hypothetical protein VIL55_01085 [Naasia sp.]|jgi:hypothetical protein
MTPADAEPHRDLWLERDPRAVRRIDEHGRPTVEDLRRWSVDTSSNNGPGLGLMPIVLEQSVTVCLDPATYSVSYVASSSGS